MKPINMTWAEAFRYQRHMLTDEDIQEMLDNYQILCEEMKHWMPEFDPDQAPDEFAEYLPGTEWQEKFPDFSPDDLHTEFTDMQEFCEEIEKAYKYNHGHGLVYDKADGVVVGEELRVRGGRG